MGEKMVAVTGSTGLVGSRLVPALREEGYEVCVLSRREGRGRDDVAREVLWWPDEERVDGEGLEGLHAMVHLAGENIASGRWNEARKRRIEESRVKGTRAIAEALAARERRPEVLVCASAIGYYGDRGDEVLTEESEPGEGFLPEVCRRWEAAADPAREAGIRVVHLRLGVVLSKDGGALGQMLLPFKLGVGGRVGDGKQSMSWVSLEDVVRAVLFSIRERDLEGPVNLVAPHPVTNAEFTKTLGAVLRRPTVLPLPAFAARLVFGEMADALLLASARVAPRKLEEASFEFEHPDLESALRAELT